MQGNGWKLADIFDGAVHREAIGQLRDHAEIHMEGARLFEDIRNDAGLAVRGEKYLIDKQLADLLKKRIKRTYLVAGGRSKAGAGAGEFIRIRRCNEALEAVTKMADALQIEAKNHGIRPSAHNEHIPRAHAVLEAAIEQEAIGQAAQAEADGDQPHRYQNNAAVNKRCAHQVEHAGEQQP